MDFDKMLLLHALKRAKIGYKIFFFMKLEQS